MGCRSAKVTGFMVGLLVVLPAFARQASQNQPQLDDAEAIVQSDSAKAMQLMMQQMQEMDKASDKLFEDFFGEDSNADSSTNDFDKLQQQFLNRLNQQTYGAQVTQQNSQKSVTMRVNVPGLDESSLNIRVENGFLHLSGNAAGPFEKIFPLPDEADAGKMEVRKNGDSIELIFAKLVPGK